MQYMSGFFRKITALLPNEFFGHITNKHVAIQLRALLFFILVICAGILLQILVFLDQKLIYAKKEYEGNAKQFRYWSGVALQFPNIPDILYNASVSALNVGKISEAARYLDKALQIDPLFKDARELRKSVGER